MLVLLKRNYFAPNGVQYRPQDGLAEIPDDYKDQLPKDARVMEMGGVKFDVGKPKLPGFGAKPAHEQVLDEIPGGAPTRIITAAGTGQMPTTEQGAKEAKKEMDLHIARAEEKAKLVEDMKLDLDAAGKAKPASKSK